MSEPHRVNVREAMAEALYGPSGFFIRERPADHFRTSALASALFARALGKLIAEVDEQLGRPDDFTVVDMGAGRGELVSSLLAQAPTLERASLVAVEKANRPAGLDDRIEWRHELPERVIGVVLGCEWLDNVPLDLAEVDAEGRVRYRRTDGTLGELVTGADARWLARWWPISEPGELAEIGRARDDAWHDVVRRLDAGLAVAIDYGHLRERRPWAGTLTGFRHGREVPPRFDGSTDITAHVAMDSLVRPGDVLIPQRDALHRLGVTGRRPPPELAARDPRAYLLELSRAGEAAELTDPQGLGAHWWLLHQAGIPLGWHV